MRKGYFSRRSRPHLFHPPSELPSCLARPGRTPRRPGNRRRISYGARALNPNVVGSFPSGRREINWDGVPDASSAPNNLPANFFNVTLRAGSSSRRRAPDSR